MIHFKPLPPYFVMYKKHSEMRRSLVFVINQLKITYLSIVLVVDKKFYYPVIEIQACFMLKAIISLHYFDPLHKSVAQTVIKLEKDSFEAKKKM